MPENEYDTWRLTRQGRIRLEEQQKEMQSTSLHSWFWARPDFREAMDYLHAHSGKIHKGEYLSDTPGKEVWRYQLPRGLGDYPIIYKRYDCSRLPLLERLHKSLALRETMNLAALQTIGVPVAEFLACSENRHVGFLREAIIVTKCIPNSFDGSVLTPTGNLWDKKKLRMGFCKKAMEQIATAHRCGCFHSLFHPNKILFNKDCDEDNPRLVWIDVANCQFHPQKHMKIVIPTDLVTLFVDLRLSTDESKLLCEYYLQFNPNCGFTVDSLWNAMKNLPHD